MLPQRGGISSRGGRGGRSIHPQTGGSKPYGKGQIDLNEYLYGKTSIPKKESEATTSKASPSLKEVVASEPIFVLKKTKQNVLEINPEDYSINNPGAIAERYLGNNPFPHELSLTRETYEKILTQLNCVTIDHTRDEVSHSILYSKLVLHKIFHQKEWGLNPFQEKIIHLTSNLQKQIGVNYWTYQQAMMKVLFLNNLAKRHSWFIVITKEVTSKELPAWFYRWWNYFGGNLEILPEPLKDCYNNWVELSPIMRQISTRKIVQDQNLVHFFTDCQIPWVWTWNFTIGKDSFNQLCLQRQFLLKWWGRINVPEKIQQINSILRDYEKLKEAAPAPISENFSIKELYEDIRLKYPHKDERWQKKRVVEIYQQQFKELFQSPIFFLESDDDMSLSGKSSAGDNDQDGLKTTKE